MVMLKRMAAYVKFVLDGKLSQEDCYRKSMDVWYTFIPKVPSPEDKAHIETVIRTWYDITLGRGTDFLEGEKWHEHWLSFTLGSHVVKAWICIHKTYVSIS